MHCGTECGGCFWFPFREDAIASGHPVTFADSSTRVPEPSASRLADGVLVINLDQRAERLDRFAAMAATQPLLAGWQRLAAVNGTALPGYGQAPWFRGRQRDKCWAGRAGCTLSHRKAIEHARDMGWDRVLIMEDDVALGPTFAADAADLLATLKAGARDWAMCYLGASKPIGPCRKAADLGGGRTLYQIFGCNGTFAYLMERRAFDWVLAHLPTADTVWPWVYQHRAIDRWYARNLSRQFLVHSVSPNLIGHYASFSDIGQRAGADVGVTEAATTDTHPLRPTSDAAFHLLTRLLRVQFRLAGAVSRIRCALARRRGF